MTTDIVERLRELARNYADGVAGMEPQGHFMWEASDEIERLQTLNDHLIQDAVRDDIELERLRAALQPFAYEYQILMLQQDGFPAWHTVKTGYLREARRALEPKP